jgi:DNA-binding PadR family transcriptional regulator
MHPYEMRKVMRERHKDDRLVLKPGSLYNAVTWLLEEKLIEEGASSRAGRRPQRTTYHILRAGEIELKRWIAQMLAELRNEPSSFSVALDHLVHLTPAAALGGIENRCAALRTTIDNVATIVKSVGARVGRINVIEVEFDLAMFRAQLGWLEELTAQLRDGRFTWDTAQILKDARAYARSSHKPL